jgi:hypothetical protein
MQVLGPSSFTHASVILDHQLSSLPPVDLAVVLFVESHYFPICDQSRASHHSRIYGQINFLSTTKATLLHLSAVR